MKIALLGDTHFDHKQGNVNFQKYFKKSFNWFFDVLQERDIDLVVQLGDLFDNRKSVGTISLAHSKEVFFDRFWEQRELIALVGNHDIPYKDSVKDNSPIHLLQDNEDICIIQSPTKRDLGCHVDIIPWICKENQEEIFKFIKNSKSDYLFGHLELDGFNMQKGVKGHGGMSPKLFEKYKHVFSGHYHSRSTDGNVTYVGTPYQLTWADYDDPKGFHILDTVTGEVEFFQNPFEIFHKVYYTGNETVVDFTQCTDKYCKLYVVERTDWKHYDAFVRKIEDANPYELKIIEETSSIHSDVADTVDVFETTDLIEEFVDGLETDLNKDKLKQKMKEIYLLALNEGS